MVCRRRESAFRCFGPYRRMRKHVNGQGESCNKPAHAWLDHRGDNAGVGFRLNRGWVIGLTSCSVVLAGLAFWNGLRGVTVTPPSPEPVCPMVRVELFDLLVP